MSVPRFLFLATAGVGVAPPGASASEEGNPSARPPDYSDFLWRLVAGNNRLLGRSPSVYSDLEQCRQAVSWLISEVAGAVAIPAPGSRPGRWSWQLALPGTGTDREILAVSARSYERQRESRYSVENFVAAVPVAAVVNTVAVRPRARQLMRTELRSPPARIISQRVAPEDTFLGGVGSQDANQPRTG